LHPLPFGKGKEEKGLGERNTLSPFPLPKGDGDQYNLKQLPTWADGLGRGPEPSISVVCEAFTFRAVGAGDLES
jgi:hypothetical protein